MSTLYVPRDIHDPVSVEGIDARYFTDIICNYHQRDDIEVLSLEAEQMKPGFTSSFIGGLVRYTLTCRNKNGR